MAALLLAVRTLFPKAEQLFVVILSRPGRVDADPDMPEALVLFQHVPYLPGVDKAGKVIVHVQGNAPDLRVAFQESSQRHMGGPAQGQAPAVPSPSLQLLQRGMGKGVNGRLEYGELPAARTLRRVAEAEFFIAAGHIFFRLVPMPRIQANLAFPPSSFPTNTQTASSLCLASYRSPNRKHRLIIRLLIPRLCRYDTAKVAHRFAQGREKGFFPGS